MQTRKLSSLAIVAPFYNEQALIDIFYTELRQTLDEVEADIRFVFVDDGSRDATLALLHQLADADPRITVIALARNFGHQIALTAGLDYAEADAVITMDSDLQHPPAIIPAMIDAYEQGFSVVYGVRREDKNRGWLKRVVARGYYTLLKRIANIDIIEGAVDYRLMSRDVVAALRQMRETHRYLRGMIPWIGFSSTTVDYEQAERAAGTAKYSWRKLWQLARAGLFSFSVVPLDLITYLGLLLTALSALYFVFVLVAAVVTDVPETIPGWLSQTVILLLLGGVQLISLGIIAQYIGMIFEQVKGRPLYTVKHIRQSRDHDE